MCISSWLAGLEEAIKEEEKKEHPCSIPVEIEKED